MSGQLCRELCESMTFWTPERKEKITPTNLYHPGISWSRPVQITTSKIASLRSGRFSAVARARLEPVHSSGVQ